jgi:RNA polymerase sigma factor (sigma-70 family)
MDDVDQLAEQFQAHRLRMRGVAYRMLGSFSEADDAVQEAWLRVSQAGTEGVENLGGWLTTVVARVCLNMLRTRTTRREQPLGVHMPDPVVGRVDEFDPEHEAVLSEAVGLALLVVLDSLAPAERVAFVLHDIFGIPFDEIATVMATSSAAARQLASRARRRVRHAVPVPDADLARQRDVVDAFFAASRNGDFAALVDLLHPDVVLRSDGGVTRPSASLVIRGARTLAGQAVTFAQGAPFAHPALVNGAAGVVVTRRGTPLSVMGFIVSKGKIVAIDVLADPERLAGLGLAEWPG